MKAHRFFDLPKYAILGKYREIPSSEFSTELFTDLVREAKHIYDKFLQDHSVLGVLVKVEVAPGPTKNGEQTLRLHWHAFAMLNPDAQIGDVIHRCQHGRAYSLADNGTASDRYLNYLRKAMLHDSHNWDIKALRRVASQLRRCRRRTRLIWRGGLFDGRKLRWAFEGAAIAAHVADPKYPRPTGGMHRQIARPSFLRHAMRRQSVRRWGYLSKYVRDYNHLGSDFLRQPSSFDLIVQRIRYIYRRSRGRHHQHQQRDYF